MSQATTPQSQEQPLCPEGDFRFWVSVGGGALLLLCAGYLVGLRGLYPSFGTESVPVLARISGVLSALVWVALCTGAGSLAVVAIALVRGRRAGAGLDIAARAFACVAVASLVRFVPLEGAVLKGVFDAGAFVASAALLGRAAFRVRLLDAAAAVALAFGAVAALTALAYAVVWAVLPK